MVPAQQVFQSENFYRFTLQLPGSSSTGSSSGSGSTWLLGCYTNDERREWLEAVVNASRPLSQQVWSNPTRGPDRTAKANGGAAAAPLVAALRRNSTFTDGRLQGGSILGGGIGGDLPPANTRGGVGGHSRSKSVLTGDTGSSSSSALSSSPHSSSLPTRGGSHSKFSSGPPSSELDSPFAVAASGDELHPSKDLTPVPHRPRSVTSAGGMGPPSPQGSFSFSTAPGGGTSLVAGGSGGSTPPLTRTPSRGGWGLLKVLFGTDTTSDARWVVCTSCVPMFSFCA